MPFAAILSGFVVELECGCRVDSVDVGGDFSLFGM